MPQWTQCSVEATGGGSILATARAWGERDASKQSSSKASRYALATALARLRNWARLCCSVLQTPPKTQPTECLLQATSLSQNTALAPLHLFALNNPISCGAAQGPMPLPACRKHPPLSERQFGNLPSWWLGTGWVGSTERGQPRALGRAVRLQGLPHRPVRLPPVDAFLLCMRQFFSLFH